MVCGRAHLFPQRPGVGMPPVRRLVRAVPETPSGAILRDHEPLPGTYLWTIDWCADPLDTSCAEIPQEHKCAHIIALDNGCYAAQPNNRILWREPSFIVEPLEPGGKNWPPTFKTNRQTWSVEGNWTTSADDNYFYGTRDGDPFVSPEEAPAQDDAERPACPSVDSGSGFQCSLASGHKGMCEVWQAGACYTWKKKLPTLPTSL